MCLYFTAEFPGTVLKKPMPLGPTNAVGTTGDHLVGMGPVPFGSINHIIGIYKQWYYDGIMMVYLIMKNNSYYLFVNIIKLLD